MLQDNNLIQEIIYKIELLPLDKLKEVEKLVNTLSSPENKKSKLLKFAGSWKDMKSEDLNDLFQDLKNRRKNNKRRNRMI